MAKPRRAGGFYDTPAWKAVRKAALLRDGYRCTICNVDVSGKGMARVDHIKSVRTHPHLALTLSNIRTLCAAHDNQAHREKWRGSGAPKETWFSGSDATGMPLDPNHFWYKRA